MVNNLFSSRRMFMSAAIAMGAGAIYYLNRPFGNINIYANNIQVLLHTCYHLFPNSKLGPSAIDLHISDYLLFVLKDKRIPKEDISYFLKGASWLEESSFEEYKKSFLELDTDKKESLLQLVSRKRWGENFIHSCLNYIFEAMLSAPVYGSNIAGKGWKWLEHDPGFPQPVKIKDIQYDV